jgi:hypothetical protein
MAFCCGGTRYIFPPCGRLVDVIDDDVATGDGCPAAGGVSTRATQVRAPLFRSRIAIHQREFPASARFARHRMQHEPSRQLLGYSVYDEHERLPNLTRAGIGFLPLR